MTQSATTANEKEKKDYKYKVSTAVVILPNGEHKQIKAYGKSKREAESKLRIKINQIEQGLIYNNSKTPAMQYFREWLQRTKQEGKRKVADATYKEYETRLASHLAPVFDDLALENIQPAHCEQVLNRVNGASQSDINKTYQLLKSGFKAAVTDGLIRRSPMAAVSRPKGTTGKRRALTNEEYVRLRQAITDVMRAPLPETHAAAVFAAISLGCGCRPGEVAALRWSNIKLTGTPTLSVTGAVKKGTTFIGTPKTEAGRRSIGIPSWLVEILQQYKQERGAALDALNKKQEEDLKRHSVDFLKFTPDNLEFSLLFPDKRVVNQPLSETKRRDYWKTMQQAARLTADVELYCLRHTFCTRGAKAGVDLRTMRYLMGHESIEITSRIYTDITEDMKAIASAAFEALEDIEKDSQVKAQI